MPNWYYEKRDLKKTPSLQDGIDSETEQRYRREGARFIITVGTKMGLRYDTMATGVVYFHRFYMFHSFRTFPRYVTACCCLFLAGKVEETPKKCKDIIKTARSLLTDQQFAQFGEDPKEEVMTLERILLQTIKFDLQVDHPYGYLLKYAKSLKGDKAKLHKMVQMAWTFINDSLCTTLCLQWEPEIIAIALMYLAGKLSKFEVVDWNGRTPHQTRWWDMFVEDMSIELLEDICHQVLDLYSTPVSNTPQDSPPLTPSTSKPSKRSQPPSPVTHPVTPPNVSAIPKAKPPHPIGLPIPRVETPDIKPPSVPAHSDPGVPAVTPNKPQPVTQAPPLPMDMVPQPVPVLTSGPHKPDSHRRSISKSAAPALLPIPTQPLISSQSTTPTTPQGPPPFPSANQPTPTAQQHGPLPPPDPQKQYFSPSQKPIRSQFSSNQGPPPHQPPSHRPPPPAYPESFANPPPPPPPHHPPLPPPPPGSYPRPPPAPQYPAVTQTSLSGPPLPHPDFSQGPMHSMPDMGPPHGPRPCPPHVPPSDFHAPPPVHYNPNFAPPAPNQGPVPGNHVPPGHGPGPPPGHDPNSVPRPGRGSMMAPPYPHGPGQFYGHGPGPPHENVHGIPHGPPPPSQFPPHSAPNHPLPHSMASGQSAVPTGPNAGAPHHMPPTGYVPPPTSGPQVPPQQQPQGPTSVPTVRMTGRY